MKRKTKELSLDIAAKKMAKAIDTHLSHFSPPERLACTKRALAKVRSLKAKVVIADARPKPSERSYTRQNALAAHTPQ